MYANKWLLLKRSSYFKPKNYVSIFCVISKYFIAYFWAKNLLLFSNKKWFKKENDCKGTLETWIAMN